MSRTGTAHAASDATVTQQDHDACVMAKAADDNGDGVMSEAKKSVYRLPNGKLYSKECEYDQSGRDLQWPHWTHGMKRFATEGGIWLFSTIVWAFMLVYGAQAASATSAGCAGSRLWNPEHEDKWFTTAAWWDVAWACGLAANAAVMLIVLAVIA